MYANTMALISEKRNKHTRSICITRFFSKYSSKALTFLSLYESEIPILCRISPLSANFESHCSNYYKNKKYIKILQTEKNKNKNHLPISAKMMFLTTKPNILNSLLPIY